MPDHPRWWGSKFGGRLWAMSWRSVRVAVLATALVSLRAAAQHPPDSVNAQKNNVRARAADLFRQAKHLLGEGAVEPARQKVAEGLKLDPHSALGYNLLGLIDGQEKDYKQAESDFKNALALDSRSADTHNNLGSCYVAENKLDLADKEFRAALRSDPANRGANYNLGLVLLAQKHPREASVHFLRVHPADVSTLFNLTQAYFAAGEGQKGLEAAERLSAQGKNDVRLHFTLGVLLASNKQLVAASRELEAADALEPGTFEVLYNLGHRRAGRARVLASVSAPGPDSGGPTCAPWARWCGRLGLPP